MPSRRGLLATLCWAAAANSAGAVEALESPGGRPAWRELHHRLDISGPGHAQDVALTLDACSGSVDRALIATLVRLQIPVTIFVTRRWLLANPGAVRDLIAHPALFDIQNHGAAHVPAIIGSGVFGMQGARDSADIEREVAAGAQAIVAATGRASQWYRGAGAAYDRAGEQAIGRLGHRIAGFSLNADDGGTLGADAVARRLRQVQPGDIVIAHMNRPHSGTAQAFAAVLPELQARKLRFVTLSQAAGVQPALRGKPSR